MEWSGVCCRDLPESGEATWNLLQRVERCLLSRLVGEFGYVGWSLAGMSDGAEWLSIPSI